MRRTPVSIKNKKRIGIGFLILALMMIGLAFRVAWIQVVDADELTQKAIDQQTQDVPVEAKRGNILFNKFVSSVYVNCHTQRTVAFYAKQLNISAGRFSAVIREVSGKSPMHWIELFTMTKIRRMLSDSEASIKEITDSMAFPDQSTFGRYFKAHEGISPSEYRARLTGRLSGAQ